MFNRNPPSRDAFSSSSPIGSGPAGGRPPRDRYNALNQQPPSHQDGHDPRMGGGYAAPLARHDYDTVMTDGYDNQRNFGSAQKGWLSERPAERPMPSRPSVGRTGGVVGIDEQAWSLRPAKSPDSSYTYGNLYVF